MKEYTEQEVIQLIAGQPDVNFLAAAITPWHALGIDATILHLTEQGIALKGYIMMVAHNVTGSAINETNFHMTQKADIQIIYMKEKTEKRTFKEKLVRKAEKYRYYLGAERSQSNEVLYWVTPLKPSYELIPRMAKAISRKIQFFIADEGLGSYVTSKTGWCKRSFLEGNIKAGIKSIWTIFFRETFFLHRLNRRKQVKYYQLLLRDKNKWIINETAVKDYRAILTMQKRPADQKEYENKILINGEMLYESGLLTDNADVELYQQICKYAEQYQIPVILKPHPRENKAAVRYAKLPCDMESKGKAAQEVILATSSTRPLCIVGIVSTTLVTAKVLFGIDAISLNYLIDRKALKDCAFFKRFNKTFDNLLYLPKTMEELNENLEEIRSNYGQVKENQ